MAESNSLIRASAGTGKTFALATRFIRLMMLNDVDPAKIVALTFSRAAAQEIYAKIITRLCDASEDDASANKEWKTLLDDLEHDRVPNAEAYLASVHARRIPHAAADFRHLLRKLADTQHLGTIATLDSFILRIVRYFPEEMGFQHAVEVLDPQGESNAIDEAVRNVFSKTDGSGAAVAEAYVTARKGEFVRTCLDGISSILNREGWRSFVIAHEPQCRRWTVESMCAALNVPPDSRCPDLSCIPFNDMGRKGALSPEETFVRFARSHDGTAGILPTAASAKALMTFFWNNPNATRYEYSHYGKPFVLDCGADGAAAIRGAIRHMVNVCIRRQLEIVKAKIDLVLAVEGVYDKATRRSGKLTFGDFTAFSGESEFSERGISLQNVAFRFDSKFDHWALDEFQDTSELQWRCLRELVENAAGDGYMDCGRTAMAVGDPKQSIYTWRGASARPFVDIAGWPAFAGCDRELRRSFRYGPNIAAFVNKVFGLKNITADTVIPAACAPAVREWQGEWSDHIGNESPDYVKVVGADGDDDSDADNAILATLLCEVNALWKRHQDANSKDTVGILVRGNSDGSKVAEHLRSHGLPVVWEGMNTVHDLPAVQAVLALLRLGDHPEDTAAWQSIEALWNVRRIMLPACDSATSASTAISRLLARQGLARTVKDLCAALIESGSVPADGLSAERLRQLVSCAVSFEAKATPTDDTDAFLRFLTKAQTRELAVSSDVIRILTIHRSKGLGIDHVFVPLFERSREKSAIDRPKSATPLYNGGDWVLPHVSREFEAFHEETHRAYEAMRSNCLAEALRTYYVAFTRAKKSMCVIFPDDSNPADYPKGLLMRDLVVNAIGHPPCEWGTPPQFEEAFLPSSGQSQSREGWTFKDVRETIECVSPSHAADLAEATPRKTSKSLGLFDADYGAAAHHGVDVHAAYQAIEWADGDKTASLPKPFREAFAKPSQEASVWRERDYEIFDESHWETGQFDRVVFTGTGKDRAATIYDFKTSCKRQEESDAAFSERMREQYGTQMESYRKALSRLTGIPASRIEAKLLLEATGRVVAI